MEMRTEIRKIMRKRMRDKERLTVIVDKKRVLVIYYDASGWRIGDTLVGKLVSYSYFKHLIKREFGRRIRNSQVRWLFNWLKRKHIRKGRLGTNQTPDLLKRRERRMGGDWGRWENKQLLRIGGMDGKREVMKGLMDDIYREEFEGERVFELWSPTKVNLEGGGNLPLQKGTPNGDGWREGRREE